MHSNSLFTTWSHAVEQSNKLNHDTTLGQKVFRVFRSCTTGDQLVVAIRFADLALSDCFTAVGFGSIAGMIKAAERSLERITNQD